MPRFNKNTITELRSYLYGCSIHDAILKECAYDGESRQLVVDAVNPIFHVAIKLVFCDVKYMFWAIGEDTIFNNTAVNSLTIEDNYTNLAQYIHACVDSCEDCVYSILQMFSGDEFHVVSKELYIDTTD